MTRLKNLTKLNGRATYEARHRELEDGLSAIYQDDQGEMIDVTKLEIKKKISPLVKKLFWLVGLVIAIAAGWWSYDYFGAGARITDVEVAFDGPRAVMAGQEASYTLRVINHNRTSIRNVVIEAGFPENFILTKTEPKADQRDNYWQVGKLNPGQEKTIVITGKMYNTPSVNNTLTVDCSYQPENFSSTFKKTGALDVLVDRSGLEYSLTKPGSALVGEVSEVVLKYKQAQDGQVDNFRLTVEPERPGSVELLSDEQPDNGVTVVKPWVWQINNLDQTEKELRVRFKFLDKLSETENLKFKFEYRQEEAPTAASSTPTTSPSGAPDLVKPTERFLPLMEEVASIQIVKNDLNLLMIMNGSDKDQNVDFGQTLNYSVNYRNKGNEPMENVVIMAVLDSDLLDWESLNDKFKGEVSGNTIVWSEKEIPELASIGKDEKGNIDFSLKVKERTAVGDGSRQTVTARARFEVKQTGDVGQLLRDIRERDQKAQNSDASDQAVTSTPTSNNNSSNIITSKINSDLNLVTKLRYFSPDNLAVGSGPLPLTVGQATTFRVYLELNNTLHNLSSVNVTTILPPYAKAVGELKASLGSLSYDQANRRLVWNLARLDKLSSGVKAEFNLEITPTDQQRNQLLILLPKQTVSAHDDDSGSIINKDAPLKTSRLEDDDLIEAANIDLNNGLVK